MQTMLPIRYRDFWDVPRIFLATYRGQLILFDCPFDEQTEDYSDRYRLYLLPPMEEGALNGSWADLPGRAKAFLGEVPVSEVRFDPTRRQQVDSTVLVARLPEVQAS